MNSINNKVILKKLNRLSNVNKYVYNIIIDISKGITQVRPVYKVDGKKTIINVHLELIEILNKLNINSKVKILSNIKDTQKYRIIDSSDLIVLASINRAESFGISMLEGIQAGKPGIVSDIKGS
jgi:glycosyltransferase involved in cell wall biosynthesis